MDDRNTADQSRERMVDKPSWEHPDLVLLGKLGDLVQGGGKTGANRDSDPQVTTKQGVG